MDGRLMPTNRIPTRRHPRRPRISARAIELFDELRSLPCICPERDWSRENYWKWQQCAFCDERGRLQGLIHTELGLKPWEDAIENPAAVSPYPVGSWAYEHDKPDEAARARWRMLEQASKEMKAARR
jgi:hypothetical protein